MNSRLQKLRHELAARQLDVIFVSQPENRQYLSGFDGSSGYLLISADTTILATDFRYTEQAANQAPDFEVFAVKGDMSAWLPELFTAVDSGQLAFESGHVTVSLYRKLNEILKEKRPGLKLTPVEGLVESLRAVKGPGEIELITRAAEIADTAFEQVSDEIQVGATEKNVAWRLEKTLRELGSEAVPFDIIVASGPNAALPHAEPSERRIQAGEPIVIDMGARIGGYCSDLSRTLCLGTPDDTFRQVYGTVLEAQSAAIGGIEEGISGEEADKLARAIIERAGYGKAFGHSLGHGVGLVPHEEPRLGPNSTDKLRANMVFSIEPGIYLTGWGGVRIEDLAVIDDGRPRLLSRAKKMNITGGSSLP